MNTKKIDIKNYEDRIEQITRWANYIKTHSKDEWREKHQNFINAQFQMHYSFVEKMLKKKNGKQLLRKIFNISNKKEYSKFY